MSHCTECGNKLAKSHQFCSNCGTQIETISKELKEEHPSFAEPRIKRRVWPWFIVVLLLGGLVAGGFVFFDAITTGGSVTGNVIHFIQPPNPKVVDVDCKSYGSGFLDTDSRMKVEVTVQNMGGSGNIRVTGKLDQSDTAFDASDSKMIYMSKNQIQTVIFDFDSSGFRNAQCLGYAYAS